MYYKVTKIGSVAPTILECFDQQRLTAVYHVFHVY